MSPDQAMELGNELAHLAAKIADIADMLTSLYEPNYDDEPENAPHPPPKKVTLADLQTELGEKFGQGFTQAIKTLIAQYGGTKLSTVPEENYAALLENVRSLK